MAGLSPISQSMRGMSRSALEIGVTSQQSCWVSVKGQPKAGRMKPHGQNLCCDTQLAPLALRRGYLPIGGFPGNILLPQDEGGLPSFPVAPEFTAFTDKALKLQGGRKQDWP